MQTATLIGFTAACGLRDYPLAQGRYSSPDRGDFYAAFFKTPDGRSCGISPNGGPTGCDAVPIDAPPGTNETVAASWQSGGHGFVLATAYGVLW